MLLDVTQEQSGVGLAFREHGSHTHACCSCFQPPVSPTQHGGLPFPLDPGSVGCPRDFRIRSLLSVLDGDSEPGMNLDPPSFSFPVSPP